MVWIIDMTLFVHYRHLLTFFGGLSILYITKTFHEMTCRCIIFLWVICVILECLVKNIQLHMRTTFPHIECAVRTCLIPNLCLICNVININ